MKLVSLVVTGAAVLAAGAVQAQTAQAQTAPAQTAPAPAAACQKPSEPALVDGKSAPMEQLVALKGGVTAFIAASDTYQSCVLDDLKAQQAAAKTAKTPLDPAVEKTAHSNVEDNQAAKERVGKAFNDAVKAYRTAHPS
jgi:hypothetical protein